MTPKTPSSSEAERQMNTRLPESLHRSFKAQCALAGISIEAAVVWFAGQVVDGKVKLPKPADTAHHR
jgi:predicted HicB family RNase H-like nuclease